MRDTPFTIVALWCWYDGRAFHGYQAQPGVRTVQAELLRAFAEARLPRNPVVAGRTDKGVSARMQVLSARVLRDVDPRSIAAQLSPHLPADLGVVLSRPAPQGFHAAFSASSKTYRYVLSREAAGDVTRLRRAAALVPGTRDFRVFHFKTSEVRARTVERVEVLEHADGVTLEFVGAQFARYMVRMLTGALTAVSTGALPLEVLQSGLTEQVPFHCPVAPAEPLTLWSVGYPAEVDPFSAAERATVVLGTR
ncbi:MAG: tRNA pseudouridine(38-40) synthase TruA [Myxococcaceae bacterium]|nr:tRNA pseudouridine(38-40) synthase TruA [Myxococcaceae bacterium]